ncbi:3-oxoacyl-ACP synthase III [Bacteriovorax sp. DB6_IX]|uniref:3-oxoacyl-ACP synthase III n=1 Tax=Bacteriovorax sp. DB6_IX TaxID=1353530 RepID=UPI00038A0A91|nr:3-oxoacyl-ACP synthase III [Bacteriovorax sp. DB6_IX]EQC52247.1 3-oxoacyl-(acyl carrier protein) synthase III [Bacteriovorax sp. DB6_IX]
MKFNNVVIEDYGLYLPEEKISSQKMEELLAPIYKRLRLPEGRLELMTGIKERGVWPTGTLPSDLSSQAARNLFNKGRVKAEDIDILIHSSVCRNFLEPSTASIVHGNLKLKDECTIFDLSNACLGMVNSWVVAANMIETGQIKRALIVSGENGGPLLEETIKRLNSDESITRKSIKKYFANLTIGSAAVAYVLTHKDLCPEGPKLISGAVMTDSTANELCQGDGDPNSLFMETDSEKLLEHGKILAKKTWDKARESLGWNEEEIDLVIGHQVGKAHKEIVLSKLNLHKRPTYDTFPFLGNTGSAALPVTLALKNDNEGIKKGDKVVLVGIGSGLSSIVLGVQW